MAHQQPQGETNTQTEELLGGRAGADEPVHDEPWLGEGDQLPRRPRRRLLAPLPVALAMLATAAAGFLGGVLAEKGQGSSSSSPATAASRLAGALRGRGAGAPAAAAGAGGAGAQASAGATAGQVAFVHGATLYVTNAEGSTVKVTTSRASSVLRSVKGSVGEIHPGETVIVSGTPGASGSINAASIRVGEGLGAGALAGLFGRGHQGAPGAGAAAGTSAGKGGGEPQLFGGG
jgi:hypothetical protein